MPDNRYLDWSIDGGGDTFAYTSRGSYETEEMTDGTFAARWFSRDGENDFLGYFQTQEQAEDACQNHYETWRAEAA